MALLPWVSWAQPLGTDCGPGPPDPSGHRRASRERMGEAVWDLLAVSTGETTGSCGAGVTLDPSPRPGLNPVETRGDTLIPPLPTFVLSLSCSWVAARGTRWLNERWAVAQT